jgi:outer membrane protein W
MKKLITLLVLMSFTMLIPSESNAQQAWRHQAAITGGMGVPFGDYADANKIGTGFGLDATYYIQMPKLRSLFLSASIGFMNMPINYGEDNIQGWEASTRIIPMTLGARYNFKLSGWQPYAGLEVGYFLEKNTVENDVAGKSESSYENAGIIPKFGIRYPLMNQIDFDANVKLNMIFREDAGTSSNNNLTYVSFNIGIAYTIGKSSRFE